MKNVHKTFTKIFHKRHEEKKASNLNLFREEYVNEESNKNMIKIIEIASQ